MQNGQTHSARHDELFITKNKALSLDQNGVIRSNKSITTASDQLDLTAIGESYPPIITQQWANLNPEKFKLMQHSKPTSKNISWLTILLSL
jgi:hypothetical protein